jgi:uncharacterized protein YjbJ (UPF0337 family)
LVTPRAFSTVPGAWSSDVSRMSWDGVALAYIFSGAIMPNNDEIKGQFDQVKGKVKQGIGDATGDQELHDEGVVDQASGEVQEGFGTAKRKVGEAVKDLGNRIKQ